MRPTFLAAALIGALTTVSVTAQAPAARAVSAAQTTAAVQLVTSTYVPNPLAKVEGSKVGLPKNGNWGARAATAAELTGACDDPGALCEAVLYHAGAPEITCRWTVMFAPGDSVGRVVSQSDTAAMYMMRAFAVGDPDTPRLLSGHSPDIPKIARSLHLTGKTRALLYVDPKGSVQGASIQEGSIPAFADSVIDGTREWKLEPNVLDGQRVWAQIAVEVVFGDGTSTVSIKRAK